jgi:hypothetical protein
MKIRTIISRRKKAFKAAPSKQKDKRWREYKVALVCQLLKGRAA